MLVYDFLEQIVWAHPHAQRGQRSEEWGRHMITFPLPGRYTTAMPQRIKTDGKIDPLTNTMIYRTHTRAL